MSFTRVGIVIGLFSASIVLPAQAAVDSYRFAHVTIATPWYIFIFLLMGIFFPFVLMAVLAWRNTIRKSGEEASEAEQEHKHK